ncbi:PilT/PilU family type 4a pilus ATPase [bacterium]|nr:PilT/PilU family type 4a pilus ATPase [bacterium]
MAGLDEILKEMVVLKASDLHLRAGSQPILRVNGKLVFSRFSSLSMEETKKFAYNLMDEKQKNIFEDNYACDISYSLMGLGRFRINIFRQRGSISLAIRLVPTKILEFHDLYLPEVLKKLSDNSRGLILVTGATGCGKSTTLASMIDFINVNRSCHIITIEDPIEFLYKDKNSFISQREIGLDTLDFSLALKRVVRQDPDVILIGEMRDLETMAAALTAAQTGHLVLSTLHTVNAVQTVTRIIDLFPPHHQNQIRLQLADTLKGVICQRLLPLTNKQGRIPAVEVLVVTSLVKKLIEDNNLAEIRQAMEQGGYYGMQTFTQSLLQLYNKGLVNLEDILSAATNPEEIVLQIKGITRGT